MRAGTITMVRSSAFMLRAMAIWFAVLLSGLVILYGRYNWEPAVRDYSWQGYLSSASMFVLCLPSLYYTLAYFVPRPRLVQIISAIVAIILTLPYRWLGLDQWYYYRDRAYAFLYTPGAAIYGSPDLQPDWFPGAVANLPGMPYEGAVFAGLALIGVMTAAFCWQRSVGTLTLHRKQAILGCLAVYGLILVQTWMHLSLRSPYTYIPHYEQPPEAHNWYHVYAFPDHRGAVNGDYLVFRALEEHFTGVNYAVNLMLIRRSAFFYFTSQFSYFFNGFYVGLVFNVALWFSAVVCGYAFISKLWNERVALFSALMIAGGSGFIVYVGQPMVYLPGFAIIIIMLYLFDTLIIRDQRIETAMLFGCLLGIGLLTYDIVAICIFFIAYGFMKRTKLYLLIGSLFIAACIYSLFMFVQLDVLRISVDQANVVEAIKPFTTILNLISHPNFDQWYVLTSSLVELYVGHLTKAFLIFPAILAAIGILFLKDRLQRLTIFFLLLPSFLVLCYMHFGNTYIAGDPRFTYAAFPAVYTLAALSLDRIAAITGGKISGIIGAYLPWVFIVLYFMWSNIDVFGFPSIYYHFYHSSGYAWLPNN